MSRPATGRPHLIRAAALSELPPGARTTAQLDGRVIALFHTPEGIFAVDNRCPHMGFPLDRGTVKDCILTCHWHHARFDLRSGGTFDQWADDVPAYPVEVRDGAVWIDLAARGDPRERALTRLSDGLERDIPLVIAKSAIRLLDGGADARAALRVGLEFGAHNRRDGFGGGLTTLVCMANLVPWLLAEDRARALYHGLSAVADDCARHPPRFAVRALPGAGADPKRLQQWLRQFVEVRDAEGAERCIATAVRDGLDGAVIAGMMFAAATDHRYLTIGHVLDFTNKAFEALDRAGWDLAEPLLTSLARSYATGDRMEESNAWRNPIDLIALLESAFELLPAALEEGRRASGVSQNRAELAAVLLGDDPEASIEAMLRALRSGWTPVDLAGAIVYAAALRVARFHTSNEFGDWDRAHHTFTFSNAVHQALARVESPELVRGAFDAAMSIYLDRFLNVPVARLPHPNGSRRRPAEILDALPALLDRQQQVNEAAMAVAEYFAGGGEARELIAQLGHLLLREDRDFHSIQSLEAAVRQYSNLGVTPAGIHLLIATTRYLAAHAPTVRAEEQTYRIAMRLHRGERLFEGEQAASQ
ncbi:MAG: nitrite reductase (NAD(P)H) small subunit [Candidatus Binataceae bacterium]